MNPITQAVRALLGLFFDDGELALKIVVLLGGTAVVASTETAASWGSMALLIVGTLVVLLLDVIRAARNR